MKQSIIVAVLLLGSTSVTLSQTGTALPSNIRATNTLDRLLDFDGINNYDILYGIPLETRREVIGDTYINTEWQKSTVLLNNDKLLEGYPTRYDIKGRQLEVKSLQGIKVINASAIKSFLCLDSITKAPHYYINASRFKDEKGNSSQGFFEVLSDGKVPLFKRTTIEVKKANYRPELQVGSKNDLILKKLKYFYMKGDRVIEVPGVKKVASIFGARETEMKEFIKTNNISVRDEQHLKTLFDHYNKTEKP